MFSKSRPNTRLQEKLKKIEVIEISDDDDEVVEMEPTFNMYPLEFDEQSDITTPINQGQTIGSSIFDPSDSDSTDDEGYAEGLFKPLKTNNSTPTPNHETSQVLEGDNSDEVVSPMEALEETYPALSDDSSIDLSQPIEPTIPTPSKLLKDKIKKARSQSMNNKKRRMSTIPYRLEEKIDANNVALPNSEGEECKKKWKKAKKAKLKSNILMDENINHPKTPAKRCPKARPCKSPQDLDKEEMKNLVTFKDTPEVVDFAVEVASTLSNQPKGKQHEIMKKLEELVSQMKDL